MLFSLTKKLSSSPREGENNTFINPYSYLVLRKNSHVLNGIDNIMIDGSLFVGLYNLLTGRRESRLSFDMTSLAPIVFTQAEELGLSLCVIGSKQDEVSKAIRLIQLEFPKLNVIRYGNGYFDEGEWVKEIDIIAELNPDTVVVGMGTPMQEAFLVALRKKGWNGTGFTCGGFLHQTTENINYYPKLIDSLNLRWLYRIYDEPKLLKRYLVDYSKFILVFSYDIFVYKVRTKKQDIY